MKAMDMYILLNVLFLGKKISSSLILKKAFLMNDFLWVADKLVLISMVSMICFTYMPFLLRAILILLNCIQKLGESYILDF